MNIGKPQENLEESHKPNGFVEESANNLSLLGNEKSFFPSPS
jgi:hypothetical protein